MGLSISKSPMKELYRKFLFHANFRKAKELQIVFGRGTEYLYLTYDPRGIYLANILFLECSFLDSH